MGHYSAAARLEPKEEAEVLLLVALLVVLLWSELQPGMAKTRGHVPVWLRAFKHTSPSSQVTRVSPFLGSHFLITVMHSSEGVLGLLVFASTHQGGAARETSQAEHLRREEGSELPCQDASSLQLVQEQTIGYVRNLQGKVCLLNAILGIVTLNSSSQAAATHHLGCRPLLLV